VNQTLASLKGGTMVDKTEIDALTSTNESDEYCFGCTHEEIELNAQAEAAGLYNMVWLMLFCLAMILGCAVVIGGARKEPRILIIRNSSGVDIRSVTLGAADSSDRNKGKHGTVSPVPLGASQVYFRPGSAPPLPKTLLISWVTKGSISHAREIALAAATNSAHDSMANAMVFEIHPGDYVDIYWEVFSAERIEGRGN
jgi:hypothetical protein